MEAKTNRRKPVAWILLGIGLVGAAVFFGYYYMRYKQTEAHDPDATFMKPRVELQLLHFKKFDTKGTDLDITLQIHNPSPIGVRVDSVRYKIFMAGEQIAESRKTNLARIDAVDSTMVTLKLTIDPETQNAAFEKAIADGDDSTRYNIDAEIFLDLPALRGKAIDYKLDKTMPAFSLPKVEMKEVKLEQPGLANVRFTLQNEINNRNSFPIRFTNGRYILVIDGDTLAEGNVDGVFNVPAKGIAPLHIPVDMKTGDAVKAALAQWLKPDATEYYYFFSSKMISDNPAIEESSTVTEARGKLSDLKK